MQLFIFIFTSKPWSVFLQSHPLDTLAYQLPGKVEKNFFPLKFAHKMDLGLEIPKTNARIRIIILEI